MWGPSDVFLAFCRYQPGPDSYLEKAHRELMDLYRFLRLCKDCGFLTETANDDMPGMTSTTAEIVFQQVRPPSAHHMLGPPIRCLLCYFVLSI